MSKMYGRHNRNRSSFWVVSTIVLGLIAAGLLAYILLGEGNEQITENNQNVEQTTAPTTRSEGGTVAILGQNNTQLETQGAVPVTPQEDKPYTFKLPEGWTQVDDDIKKNPCGGEKEWKTSTFQKGSGKIIVYENGNPGGCDNNSVPDLYLDYDFVDAGSSIVVNDEVDLKFCTKQDIPNCPKGDGKVTIFVGNKNSSNSAHEINESNGNSYFFKIEDTKVEDDLKSQTKKLVGLLEGISL